MGNLLTWLLHGRRQNERICEDPGTEATLRAAMVEPAAPGEEESYRRLMSVIADDLRLRQPVHQRNWAWIPTTSVALAGMILSIIAYDAGVRNGMNSVHMVANNHTVVQPPSGNPGNQSTYTPPVKRNPTQPRIDVTEVPGASSAEANNAILAWLQGETLTKDQQEFVRLAGEKADLGDWAGAAKYLEQMADLDPASDAAINAIHAAAEIRTKRLNDAAGALGLYQRELDICTAQLAASRDPERKALLQGWCSRAELGVSLLSDSPAESSSEPTKTNP